ASARQLRAVHRAAFKSGAFIFRRDRAARRKISAGGGHRGQTGDAQGTGQPDPVRRIHPAASHRRDSAGRPARSYRPRGLQVARLEIAIVGGSLISINVTYSQLDDSALDKPPGSLLKNGSVGGGKEQDTWITAYFLRPPWLNCGTNGVIACLPTSNASPAAFRTLSGIPRLARARW